MIKNSKLIGKVIEAPAGWKDFKVGKLFEVERGNRLITLERVAGKIPFVTAGKEHMGVSDYISNVEQKTFDKHCFTIDMFGNVFFRDYSFKADDNILVCTPFVDLSDLVLLFISSVLNKKLLDGFSYSKQYRLAQYYVTTVSLPATPNNDPDFDWMERYIKAVKADYLKQKELSNAQQIKAYLSESSVTDTTITEDDHEFLKKWKDLPRKEFRVDDIFKVIKPIKTLVSDNMVPFNRFINDCNLVNCVTSGISNNGCPFRVSRDFLLDAEVLTEGITVSANGVNTGTVFVQTEPFVVVQDSYCLVFKQDFSYTVWDYLFFASLISKFKVMFDYQTKATWSRLRRCKILLPVVKGEIAISEVERYMHIQTKLTISKIKDQKAEELQQMYLV